MNKRTNLLGAISLLVVTTLVDLPMMNRIGHAHDDWYLMASALAARESALTNSAVNFQDQS